MKIDKDKLASVIEETARSVIGTEAASVEFAIGDVGNAQIQVKITTYHDDIDEPTHPNYRCITEA